MLTKNVFRIIYMLQKKKMNQSSVFFQNVYTRTIKLASFAGVVQRYTTMTETATYIRRVFSKTRNILTTVNNCDIK